MKKLFSLLLVCFLLVGLCANAMASEVGIFDTTKSFLAVMKENDINYGYKGVNSNNRERISIGMNGDNMESFTVECVFYDDNTSAAMYVWNIIEYDPDNFADVLYACNKLNADYRYVSFFCDESDNTVTAQTDAYFDDADEAGTISLLHLIKIVNVVDEAYQSLSEFDV